MRIRGREFTGKCRRVAAIVKGSMVTVIIGIIKTEAPSELSEARIG